MKTTTFVFVLALSFFPSVAQSQSSAVTTILPADLPANATFVGDCPVSMDARQGSWDHTILVKGPQFSIRREKFGQHISLTLGDIHSARIVDATVKVLGLSGRNRMLKTDAGANASPDASRVLHLTAFTEAQNGVTAELYAPGFTSITSIQLLAITYANGSTWTAPHAKVCRVTPNPMMLIADH